MTEEETLLQGLKHYQLENYYQPIWQYLELLQKWNKAYNLTAIRDLPTMITHHILDSLAITPFVEGQFILDVGTGPGLPGMILAITQPTWQLTLLDSNGKKTRFLQEVKRQLQLDNVKVVSGRVEDYQGGQSIKIKS